ncbi:MAG: hypothetical protein EA369_02695 [Bradymonadales bacterium]|nr:MAG: hypothetical protein EA369_02695 [Bradymonadales bacterium]
MILKKRRNPAVALMIVITSIVILSFGIRELVLKTGAQVDRVRNSYDRTQALYLARSTQNIARILVILHTTVSPDRDSARSTWNQPIVFPIPIEALSALSESFGAEEPRRFDLDFEERTIVDRCQDFFAGFQGEAISQVEDLSARLNLNDLNRPELQETLRRLMTRDFQLIESLRDRNIDPEQVVREALQYISAEVDFFLPRPIDYEYEPKRRELSVTEEFKMLPSVDDELFQSIKDDIVAVSFPRRPRPSKINMNTVSRELFQSLLQGVPNPEVIADRFVRERDEEGREFGENDLPQILEFLQLEERMLPIELLDTKSQFYRISTLARVGETKIELESILKSPSLSDQEIQPFVRMRVSP